MWLNAAYIDLQRPSGISPVNTDVPRFADRSTPRAQTMREVEDEFENRKSKRLSSLEGMRLMFHLAPIHADSLTRYTRN